MTQLRIHRQKPTRRYRYQIFQFSKKAYSKLYKIDVTVWHLYESTDTWTNVHQNLTTFDYTCFYCYNNQTKRIRMSVLHCILIYKLKIKTNVLKSNKKPLSNCISISKPYHTFSIEYFPYKCIVPWYDV